MSIAVVNSPGTGSSSNPGTLGVHATGNLAVAVFLISGILLPLAAAGTLSAQDSENAQNGPSDVKVNEPVRNALGPGLLAQRIGLPGERKEEDERWFILFPDGQSLDSYARLLDAFEIELAVLLPGKAVYVSNFSAEKPTVRVIGEDPKEDAMLMAWRGGNRRLGDSRLLERADIEAAGAVIVHFYPKQTEQLLAKAEKDFAQRPVEQIRRTYFAVRPKGKGFEFAVQRQSYQKK